MVGHYTAVILIGFVSGLIARFIMPGANNPGGFIFTTALGIIGAVVANFVAGALGWTHGHEGVNLISGTVGAIVLLLAYHLVSREPAI